VDIDAADHRPGDDRRRYAEPGRNTASNADAGSYSHAGSESNSSADADAGPERDSLFSGAGSFCNRN
jgi:hypothetical protein